jgi:hypothetical protein
MMSGPRPALACGAAPHYWFALHDASITGVLSDMGRRPKPRVGAAPAQTGVHHQPTRPCAQINGNMERFNRIPLDLVSPHDARNSGPVDRAAPPRTTKGGCLRQGEAGED